MKLSGKYILISLITAILHLGGFFPANAADENPSETELLFAEWINDARKNPLALAASLGMDTEKIWNELPDLHDILINGIEPLVFDVRIYGSARSHAEDMIAGAYYASQSPEGNTVEDRLFARHYFPVTAGESLGMISFVNYMDSKKAARLIFENMFREELKPGNVQRNILNPNRKDGAVGLSAGLFDFESSSVNVYVAVCDFADDNTASIELSISDRINEERKIAGDMFPLVRHDSLYSAAKEHIHDMASRIYFGNISPEGRGPLDRADENEYYAVSLTEILGAMVLSDHFVPPAVASRVLYEEMLNRDPVFFDRHSKHMGIAFEGVVFDIGDGNVLKAYMLMAEVATDSSIFSPMIPEDDYGNFVIFSDDYFGVAQ
ncbi:MAG: hypothetical protein V2I97_07510 [Desulfococcaceae bacterium]|jgi:uncharacterized protein YkwD|nr:hypothetical protein [Desulfococcaceae bacterium]